MEEQTPSHSIAGVTAAILIVGVIAVAAFVLSQRSPGQLAVPPQSAAPTEADGQSPAGMVAGEQVANMADLIDDDDAVLGDPAAPIKVIEFSDLQCPFCARYHQELFGGMQALIDEGRIQYVFKHFPLSQLHAQAEAAAHAAVCAQEQDKFWEYTDQVFVRQSDLSEELLVEIAGQLALDETAFATCSTSEQTSQAVAHDLAAGIAAGVTGTPTFIVNGHIIEGALQREQVEQLALPSPAEEL